MTKDVMAKRLTWMKENVEGAYYARHEHNPNCPQDHVDPTGHCTNSGTCIIVCCYMEGLGKVLNKGKGGKAENLNEFAKQCMPDFLSQTRAQFDKRGVTFYGAIRSGLVHGYPTREYKWGRKGLGEYWYQVDGKPTLNIDQFVAGFIDGVARFKHRAEVDTDLRTKFEECITREPPRRPRGKARRK